MTISIIRPPLVYGKDSPGNFHRLANLAGKLPLFPLVENRRSMIYIENLCELIRLILINGTPGLFCPQNNEHIVTSQLFADLARLRGKNVKLIKIPEKFIKPVCVFKPFKKLFASLAYDEKFSSCFDNAYNTVGYGESLKRGLGMEEA